MELKVEAARNYSLLPCSSEKKINTNVSIRIYACLCLCTDRQYKKSPCRVTVSQGAPTRSYVTQNALRVNLNCKSNPCIDKELKKKKKMRRLGSDDWARLEKKIYIDTIYNFKRITTAKLENMDLDTWTWKLVLQIFFLFLKFANQIWPDFCNLYFFLSFFQVFLHTWNCSFSEKKISYFCDVFTIWG